MTADEKKVLIDKLIALQDKAESDAWVAFDRAEPGVQDMLDASKYDGKAEAYATVIKLIEDMP